MGIGLAVPHDQALRTSKETHTQPRPVRTYSPSTPQSPQPRPRPTPHAHVSPLPTPASVPFELVLTTLPLPRPDPHSPDPHSPAAPFLPPHSFALGSVEFGLVSTNAPINPPTHPPTHTHTHTHIQPPPPTHTPHLLLDASQLVLQAGQLAPRGERHRGQLAVAPLLARDGLGGGGWGLGGWGVCMRVWVDGGGGGWRWEVGGDTLNHGRGLERAGRCVGARTRGAHRPMSD